MNEEPVFGFTLGYELDDDTVVRFELSAFVDLGEAAISNVSAKFVKLGERLMVQLQALGVLDQFVLNVERMMRFGGGC